MSLMPGGRRRADRAGRTSNRRTRQLVLRWHRRIGLISSLLILVLTLSGVVLLRTEQLGLDRAMIRSERLANWYGLKTAGPPTSFAAGTRWITVIDGFVYLDGELAGEDINGIVGAVPAGEQIVIAARDALYVLDRDGLLIERAQVRPPPSAIITLAVTPAGQPVIQTGSGRYILPAATANWQPFSGPARRSRPATAPERVMARVRQAHGLGGLPVSRLLLDLHTGRLFGPWGPYLMDLAAVFLILLTMSGIYNWSRARRR